MRDNDLRAAMSFFAARLRGVDVTETRLLRWTRHKLRNDTQAVAELMLTVGIVRRTFDIFYATTSRRSTRARRSVKRTPIPARQKRIWGCVGVSTRTY